jgi:hypothetical protein
VTRHNFGPDLYDVLFAMKKKPMNEAQLLELLKKVLPKATDDAKLAQKIFSAVEHELKATSRTESFEKFCEKVELPDLDPMTILDVKRQLTAAFGEGDVTVKADKKEKALVVEVELPDGKVTSRIKVRPLGTDTGDEQEVTLKFVPFPVALPGDPELVWLLAKRENLTPDEAGMSLSKVEEEFWASKAGQKMLRDRVERSFPEFIARAPAGLLSEAGLKRHYKTPEPICVHRTLNGERPPRKGAKPALEPAHGI